MPRHRSAYEMTSPRLLARCWTAEDAESFRALVDRNDRHLRPFIGWMRSEPMPLEATRLRLLRYRERFLAGEDFRYALRDLDGRLIGELMLSTRGGGNTREVGYLLDRAATGLGYATEAAAMAARVGFEIGGIERLELHCSPDNPASVRVAEKLGFTPLPESVICCEDSEGVMRDSVTWNLTSAQYARSPAARLEVHARDESGQPMAPLP